MSWSLLSAALWGLAANVMAMLPSHDNHWRRAYFLMAWGAPLVVWLYLDHGWVPAALFVAAAASILRWPVYFLARWIKQKAGLA